MKLILQRGDSVAESPRSYRLSDDVQGGFDASAAMKRFAQLYQEFDETTKTSRKVSSLVQYLGDVSPTDAVWAVWFLCGHRPKRTVAVGKLREWCAEVCAIPEWLFSETYDFVGDLAETIALLLPPPTRVSERTLSEWILTGLLPLTRMKELEKKSAIVGAWNELAQLERFVFNKLLTGGFRVGLSQKLVSKAIAQFSGVPVDVIAHRLMGDWQPTENFYLSLLSHDTQSSETSRPYPFCLAHAMTTAELDVVEDRDAADLPDPVVQLTERLGPVQDWMLEWKWDGIRAQIIRRNQQTFVWSRGEELLTERFPEVVCDVDQLPDGTVLDGELVGWKNSHVLPFADLQKRITRKSVGRKLLDDVPVRFLAFDLLEYGGADLRSRPLKERRERLETLLPTATDATSASALAIAESLQPDSWADAFALRQSSRERRVEGLMLKRMDSEYGVGRVTGLWWKWKIEPYHCDAVLIYAQRGHGRRASKFTDYTFAAWDDEQLVPFAKAYSGLTDAEIREVDKFIRENTLDRFGPVQTVKAQLVFELAFEGLQISNRHKAGIAVRFPRITRWRRDKKIEDADSISSIRSLVQQTVPVAIQSAPRAGLRKRKPNPANPPAQLGGLFAGMDED